MSRFQQLMAGAIVALVAIMTGCGGGAAGGASGGSGGGTTYSIGGTVSGLAGYGLRLSNNGGDTFAVSGNGSFTFPGELEDGESYEVTVEQQPYGPTQTCTVTDGVGTVNGADVTGVTVSCVTASYTVGGTVSGLNGSVTLQNNGGDDLTLNADGDFTFDTALADGSTYAVTVASQPAGQVCAVTAGSSTLSGANVTNVTVVCSTPFTVGGSVTGLTTTGLVLQNNGGDDLTIDADGAFTFTTEVGDGQAFEVTVLTQPSGQHCNVIDGSGTVAAADVTSVSIECISRLYKVVDTGQSLCYDSASGATASCSGAGHDADYAGNAPSYSTLEGGEMVLDNVTGLIWTQSTDTNGDGTVDTDDKMYQSDAVSYCSGLALGGYTWRLPTIKELYSLILFTGEDASTYTGTDTSLMTPFLDPAFDWAFGDQDAGDRIIDGQYASSTLYVSTTMNGDATMFGVNFVDGRIKGYPSAMKTFYVRCVTGNESYGVNDLVANADGVTITDNATGLMWEKGDHASTNWDDAVTTCENATTGSYSDWRLPDAKELQSIVDYTRSPDTDNSAAIDPLFTATSFTNEEGVTDWGFYWASTTHVEYDTDGVDNDGTAGVYVAFGRALGYFNMGGSYSMLDVHGAGAQRSNDKQDVAGDADGSANLGQGTFYYHGPQGDILRLNNKVRCVRDN